MRSGKGRAFIAGHVTEDWRTDWRPFASADLSGERLRPQACQGGLERRWRRRVIRGLRPLQGAGALFFVSSAGTREAAPGAPPPGGISPPLGPQHEFGF